ncbi:GFA family protein [Endothiovibrio diazotrophicus]
MKGECLCGAVAFEIRGELPHIYQCHCSECRKVTGSSANAGTIVEAQRFRWLRGVEKISSFKAASGYNSHFCSVCGSAVPNPMGDGGKFWVPAGALDDSGDAAVVAHLYMGSRAPWDSPTHGAADHDESPGLEALEHSLQRPPR